VKITNILAIVSVVFLLGMFAVLFLITKIDLPLIILPIGLILGIISFLYLSAFLIIILPKRKRLKKEGEQIQADEERKIKINEKIKSINEMAFKDLLEQNDLKQYCEIFESNKIENIKNALDLNDNDLMNIGISVLGDRKKILSLIENKRSVLERANNLLKNVGKGESKRIDKNLFIWVGTFLFGSFGVDRFMRGQILVGVVKLLTLGLGGIWTLIDFIYALTMYSKYKEEFIFDVDGNYV
jgi:TM2 domain-containing membrane protein YozV